MCMKKLDKDQVHRAVVQFCTEYKHNLYFKTLHQHRVYPAEKSNEFMGSDI